MRRTQRCTSLIVVSLLLATLRWSNAEFPDCTDPLGMQSGAIPDHAIRASSFYGKAVGPHNARLDTENNGGAWCPKEQIAPNIHEWLEIDLQETKVVTAVATQGRFGNGQGQEYAEAYMLSYQRVDGERWHNYSQQADRQQTVFTGNSNTYQLEKRHLGIPIIARRIRILPQSPHPRTICLRAELYGCDWKADIVSYSIPQGDPRGADLDLHDLTYDGHDHRGALSGGLGQLTDGNVGGGSGRRGYERWVGWRNDSAHPRGPVRLLFRFGHVRNFSAVHLHCSNQFTRDVRVFRMAELHFSVGGRYFGSEPVVLRFTRDDFMERARPVIVNVPQRVGMYVRIQLHFDARWMMLSEVSFFSELAVGNFTEESVDLNSANSPLFPFGPDGQPKFVDVVDKTGLNGQTSYESPMDSHSESIWLIAIIAGSLATIVLLFLVIVIAIVVRRRHNRKAPQHHTAVVQHAYQGNGKRAAFDATRYTGIATDDIMTRLPNGDTYRQPVDVIQRRKLPDLPDTPDLSDSNLSQEYAVPDVTKSSFKGGLPFPSLGLPVRPPPVVVPAVCDTGIILQGQSGNSLCAVPTCLSDQCMGELALCEFPRQNLRFLDRLGGGQFGEVHLCEAMNLADYLVDDSLVTTLTGSSPTLVTAKILLQNASQEAREEFLKEIRIMSRLNDENIVHVLAVCSEGEPLCVLVEYMQYGDLKQFLQKCAPPDAVSSTTAPNNPRISYGCLIYIAGQIASGMKYLESLNIVHRDLAARNCLVGLNYLIKISDFGMSRSLYNRDYYRIEGRAVLPIRWMAWESVLLGKFSTKSDVWSFAVTLWEVLTLACHQPFEELSDEQVIDNCGSYYRTDGTERRLAQPTNCPKEIYDLMTACWQHNVDERPPFREIHMFLQRKNIGYSHSEHSIEALAFV